MSQIPESSCIPKEPILKLGEGTAPVLDYGIPQKTAWNQFDLNTSCKRFRSYEIVGPSPAPK